MRTIGGFVKHIVWAMFKGFVITGVVAAVLCFGALLLATHQVTMGITSIFAAIISLLAAVLGSAVALIYHLSHIEELSQTLQRARARRQAERQQARSR
jgi:hypothetical protein